MDLNLISLLGEFAPTTAFAIFIGWMVISGRLVPREQVNSIIADRDQWKEAFWSMFRTSETQAKATEQLAEQGATTNKLLNSLPTPVVKDEENNEH